MDNKKNQTWELTKAEFWYGVRYVNLLVYQIAKNIAMLPYHIIMNTPLPGDPVEEKTPSTSKYFIVRMLSGIFSGLVEGLGYVFRAVYLAFLLYFILIAVIDLNFHMTVPEFFQHISQPTYKGDSL